ncbi:unnamed protein product [Psylliodes chrysocephalus]|uniref:Luciferin 4-monooxygenase n=1 Tax=Psylliodes chrysocephalus TaxID=3402493 RepID=A0A9P0GF39_9CUCU|nr:unnamed protein product [Psylliodes chrysocephala]
MYSKGVWLKRFINKNLLSCYKRNILNLRTFSTNNVNSNVLTCDSGDVDLPDSTIPEFILPKLEEYHKYTASECATTGRKYTFGQVRKKCKNLNKAIRHIFKLQKGDVVAILLPNCPEFAISALGILEAGLVLTTLNPIYTPDEISKQLIDSSAKVLITQVQGVNNAKAAVQLTQKHIPIIAIKRLQNDSIPEGVIDFEELVNNNDISISDADHVKSSDLAFLPYSSGTTGLPKGVELTHHNIISNLCEISHKDYNYFDPPTDSSQDVTAAVLPYYHIYGFCLSLLNMAYNGAKTVTIEKFTPEVYLSVLQKHPLSIIYVAPPLVLFFISHPHVKAEHFDHLKVLTSGAAPLGHSDEERFIKKLGRETNICQGYGLTETSPILTYSPKGTKRTEHSSGSVGKVVPNTLIKIVSPDDPTGTPLGPNEKGELLTKGPQVMGGYHKREEESKNAFLDGWFRTGDIGYYNEQKQVFITDRIKELIKVKGYQVAPAELEAVIRDHPSIEDAAVIGIPHSKYGEVPRAYIVPKKDVTLDIEDLKKYVAVKVAPYKQLQGGVQILENIPKNPSGKILRRQLKMGFEKNGV